MTDIWVFRSKAAARPERSLRLYLNPAAANQHHIAEVKHEPCGVIVTGIGVLSLAAAGASDAPRASRRWPSCRMGQVVDLWRPVARTRQIALAFEVMDGDHFLWADEEKLHRVFDNLVKNAVEAIEQGPGEVRIRVVPRSPENVEIAVEDTGPGIPEAVDVFRLFETTKANGSGLSLAIVKQIVQAHGGAIQFARRLPHGTVFRLELRRQPAGSPAC